MCLKHVFSYFRGPNRVQSPGDAKPGEQQKVGLSATKEHVGLLLHQALEI